VSDSNRPKQRGGGANQSGRRRRTPRDPARETALDVLQAVAESDAYANLILPRLLDDRGLEGLDARFTTELTFSTLRLQGRYDAIISVAAARPTTDIDDPNLWILRLGAHQILGMNVPDYAAVSGMVALARRRNGPGPAKFVNAVLRKIASRSEAEWADAAFPDPAVDLTRYLAVSQSHPEWIVRGLSESLTTAGRPEADLLDLLKVNNTAPSVSLVARPGRIDAATLLNRTNGVPGHWSPWAVGIRGNPGAIAEVRSGAAAVQDEGSQLMALALSRVKVGSTDAQWLDMCAGPGGKAADLVGLARDSGAELTAVEQHPHRAELVRKALHWRGEDQGRVVVGDATVDGWIPGAYSRVLLDAPCTGLGALRRRPESRWRRAPQDLPVLVGQQRKLLSAALEAVAPGGVVAYVTCSPLAGETDRVVDHALAKHPGFTEVDARSLLPEVTDTGEGPRVRLWPHIHGTDGLFRAVLQRT
jgi:16S rRNA (cytosine967-C5)-methyltransferase